jgi:hypothetical protein
MEHDRSVESIVAARCGIPLFCFELQRAIFGRDTDLNVEASHIAWITAYLYCMEIEVDRRYENNTRVDRLMLVIVE